MTLGGESLSRRVFLKRAFGGMAAGGAALAGGISWHAWLFAPTNPEISRRVVTIEDLPPLFDGLRIVQLSDLHFSSLVSRRYLEKCIRLANGLNPDLVFLTGDFVSRESDISRADTIRRYVHPLPEILRPLRARLGRFAVLGNHDTTINPRVVAAAVGEAGIRVLRNERLALSDGASRLPIVGLADYGTEYPNQRRAFAGVARDEPALILMHNPDLFGDGMDHRNGLIFAGHTHGGQVLLPFAPPYYVPSRYGARFLAGQFQKGKLVMLVNRGAGVIHYPVRLNCRPEIGLVTLRRG